MISPNIWSIDPPKSEISFMQGNTNDLEPKIVKKIHQHYYNNLVSIAIPDTHKTPESVQEILSNSDHYILKDVTPTDFLNRQFIEGFVKRGKFYGLSIDTRSDVDNIIAVTPCGKLYAIIDKVLYQSLGLEGKVSQYSRNSEDRYTITIDLKGMVYGSKFHSKVMTAMSSEEFEKMSFRIYWESADKDICPSSVGKYFSDKGCTVNLCQSQGRSHQVYNVNMPIINNNQNSADVYSSPHEIVELLGMMSLSCNMEKRQYLNTYCVTGKCKEMGTVRIIQWRGLFTCSTIETLYNELKKIALKHDHIPWVSMYCQGFQHSPLGYGTLEKKFGVNGNNSYVILLTPNSDCLWYQFAEAHKMISK